MSDLFRVSARAAVDLLRKGEVSPLEMVDAAAARIEATDGALNALPTPCIERARDHARRIMAGGSMPARDAVSVVPLPAALPLFLSALAGLDFVGWRRRQAAA